MYESLYERLGLWNRTHLVSVPPLPLALGLGFLFCAREDRDTFPPQSRVGKFKWRAHVKAEDTSQGQRSFLSSLPSFLSSQLTGLLRNPKAIITRQNPASLSPAG